MNTPTVTVVMPVYNSARFLKEAIDSILGQSYSQFEFLIIDDGSTDSTGQILNEYSDPKMVLIHNSANKGITYCLNQGITLSKGRYIARMDSDDISLPNRLENQVEYLDANPAVGLLGTNVISIDETGSPISEPWYSHASYIDYAWKLIWGQCIAHPSIMMRKDILNDLGIIYDPKALHIEDYDLWVRLRTKTRIACLDKVLLKYRIHQDSVTKENRDTQESMIKSIMYKTTREIIGDEMNLESFESLYTGLRHHPLDTSRFVAACIFYCRIFQAFMKMNSMTNPAYVRKDFAETLVGMACIGAEKHRMSSFYFFRKALRERPFSFFCLNAMKLIFKFALGTKIINKIRVKL